MLDINERDVRWTYSMMMPNVIGSHSKATAEIKQKDRKGLVKSTLMKVYYRPILNIKH